ncbi:MAG: hypothetical protein ACI81Y_000208 [Glaciecola sp.]|jgi:hypothetical protein
MKLMPKHILLLSLLFSYNTYAQMFTEVNEKAIQDEYEAIFKNSSDESKLKAADEFLVSFRQNLYKNGAYSYPFEALRMGKLTSPDDKFRLFNWNVNLTNGQEKYYGLIVIPKKDRVEIITLYDKSDEVENPEQAALSDQKWLGALYYRIIAFKKGGRPHYALLGWDGFSNTTNKKVIEVMSFNGGGVKFGSSVFNKGKSTQKRILFEYAEDAVMSLKYDKKLKSIVFDHLAPIGNHIDSQKEFFAPDMTFDAYSFKKGKWHFIDNIEFLRPNGKSDKDFKDPRKN